MRPRLCACTVLIAALLISVALSPGICATGSTDHAAVILSDSVTPLVAIGELSLLMDKNVGKQEALQGAKAMAATAFATELLKFTVREKRPSGTSRDSFPSGHTSEAFAMATVLSDYHPKYALVAYATAAAIGWSRVEQDKHSWMDVAAGALLGHFIAKKYTNEHVYAGPGGVGVRYRF